MKKYKLLLYFVDIHNPSEVIIEEKILEEPNIRLALNRNSGYKLFKEYKKDKIILNSLVYLLDDNDNIIASEETYSPMTYDTGIAMNYAIVDNELQVGVPPNLPM